MDYSSIRNDDPSVFNPPEFSNFFADRQAFIDQRAAEYLRDPDALIAELPDAGRAILLKIMNADTSVKLFDAQAELNDAMMELATFFAKRDWAK